MSTMPGASVRPRASTRCRAAPRSRPTATMRPPATATPPARAGPPRPSITEALSITRSCTRAPSAAIVRVRALHLEDVVDVRDEELVHPVGRQRGRIEFHAGASAVHDEPAAHAERLACHVAGAIGGEKADDG